MVRVVLVDDHPVVLAGLVSLLASVVGLELVGQARSASEALTLIRTFLPEIVVLDMGLPGMNGTALAQRILMEAPATRIVMLTHYSEPSYVQQALRVGISGYVLKSSPEDRVIQAIQAVRGGGLYLDAELEEFRGGWARRRAHRIGHDQASVTPSVLTDRELQVLRLSAIGHSNKDIARRLDLGIKSVETYRYRACKKLLLRSRLDIVRYGASQGWFLVPETSD
jgi:DNA-binding NarL/FixJ family response regulator